MALDNLLDYAAKWPPPFKNEYFYIDTFVVMNKRPDSTMDHIYKYG